MQKKYQIIQNWLCREVLHFIHSQKSQAKGMPKIRRPIWDIQWKVQPHHNKTILSFQYCKSSRLTDETSDEGMGRLRIKAAKCKYKETDRHLKEQLINRINDDMVTAEIIREHTAINDTSSVPSTQVINICKESWNPKISNSDAGRFVRK